MMRQWAGLSPEIVAVPLVFPICFDQDAPQEGGEGKKEVGRLMVEIQLAVKPGRWWSCSTRT
jgi:hypothetical protein